jgi:hypothetical protein
MTSGPPDSQTEQLSPDGRWRWDGTQWVPAQAGPAWAPPSQAFPGGNPPARRSVPTGLGHQFAGNALWSIIFGAASVLVPIFTPIYFPILPLFGLWRGVLAIRAGQMVGGVIGLVINAFGVIASLLASGLILR